MRTAPASRSRTTAARARPIACTPSSPPTPTGGRSASSCGFCRSEHNYRGGPRIDVAGGWHRPCAGASAAPARHRRPPRPRRPRDPFPLVSDRERTRPADDAPERHDDLELLLRRIIREEAGLTPVAPAEKWRGGTLVLRPGTPGLQEKSWPIETFFHKIVMLRNRLRTLEQQVNAVRPARRREGEAAGYVSGCYGSLTSFNVLFADEDDQFKGGSE